MLFFLQMYTKHRQFRYPSNTREISWISRLTRFTYAFTCDFCFACFCGLYQPQKQPPEVFYTKGVLRKFTKFTGKHLCQRLFFNKLADLRPARPATLFKKESLAQVLSCEFFVKFLCTPFLQNPSGRLLLQHRRVEN